MKIMPLSVQERIAGVILAVIIGAAAALVLWLILPRQASAQGDLGSGELMERRFTSPVDRVLEALEDHTLLPIVAAAAQIPEDQALRILEDLRRRGLAELYGVDCWGRYRRLH